MEKVHHRLDKVEDQMEKIIALLGDLKRQKCQCVQHREDERLAHQSHASPRRRAARQVLDQPTEFAPSREEPLRQDMAVPFIAATPRLHQPVPTPPTQPQQPSLYHSLFEEPNMTITDVESS